MRTPQQIIADEQTYHMFELQTQGKAQRLDERILEALHAEGYELVHRDTCNPSTGFHLNPHVGCILR